MPAERGRSRRPPIGAGARRRGARAALRRRAELDGLAASTYAAVAAVGLSLAVGLAGMPSLAQGAFVGVGALVAAHVRADAGWSPLAAAVLGTIAAAAGGSGDRARPGSSPACLRRCRHLDPDLARRPLRRRASRRLGGGAGGLIVPDGKLLGISLGTRAHYELALVLLVLALLVVAALAARRRRPGARSGTSAARLGVRSRPAPRCVSGSSRSPSRPRLGGLAGAFAVQLAGVSDPAQYGPFLSFTLFVAVLLGRRQARAGGGARGVRVRLPRMGRREARQRRGPRDRPPEDPRRSSPCRSTRSASTSARS